MQKCTHAVVEITSEAALSASSSLIIRALVFTVSKGLPAWSYGSMEDYFRAKFAIGEALAEQYRTPRAACPARADDAHGRRLYADKRSFSLSPMRPCSSGEWRLIFWRYTHFTLRLPGTFNILNALAAIKTRGDVWCVAQAARELLEDFPHRTEP